MRSTLVALKFECGELRSTNEEAASQTWSSKVGLIVSHKQLLQASYIQYCLAHHEMSNCVVSTL